MRQAFRPRASGVRLRVIDLSKNVKSDAFCVNSAKYHDVAEASEGSFTAQ